MTGLALTGAPAYAQSPPSHGPVTTVTYIVRADIDGHSKLTLRGGAARWFHIAFAAPGRHSGKNKPTIINGTKWFPKWPQPGENRDCHCFSSFFTHVVPRVPSQASGFLVKAISCRDTCSASYSGGVLKINFNDDPSPSDAWYSVKVVLTSGDAPKPR